MKFNNQVIITLRSSHNKTPLPVYIDVYNNSLSKKWVSALEHLVTESYHLEKNYCFLGFDSSDRTPEYVCEQINKSIAAINASNIGYVINDEFSVESTVDHEYKLDHARMNNLHRYFEDLQGVSGEISKYYKSSDPELRWHIRQLNLLCHEYESLILSIRKSRTAPEWRRPSQLMCWLRAPRFTLDENDYQLFGIETINRQLGGVYLGVNKAVGKHHWEVFNDEGRDSRVSELTTSSLRSQTEAAGDFDIEWARDPGAFPWQKTQLAEFRNWLTANGFDPEDKSLTIGHPKVAQVNLIKSFGTTDYQAIWSQLNNYQDVFKISVNRTVAVYDYRWSDQDFQQRQIDIIAKEH